MIGHDVASPVALTRIQKAKTKKLKKKWFNSEEAELSWKVGTGYRPAGDPDELDLHGFIAHDLVSLDKSSDAYVTVAVLRSFLDADDLANRADENFGAASNFGGEGHGQIELRAGGYTVLNNEINPSGRNVPSLAVMSVLVNRYPDKDRQRKIIAPCRATVSHIPHIPPLRSYALE
jgi:hypothetical protein